MVKGLILLSLLLAACTTVSRGNFCDVEHPVRFSLSTIDAMTDAEVKDALAHNRKGEALCGWKP